MELKIPCGRFLCYLLTETTSSASENTPNLYFFHSHQLVLFVVRGGDFVEYDE